MLLIIIVIVVITKNDLSPWPHDNVLVTIANGEIEL